MSIDIIIGFFLGLVNNSIFLITIGCSVVLLVIAYGYKYISAKRKDDLIRSLSHEDGDFLKMSGYKHKDNFIDNSFTQTNEITEFDEERPNASTPRENQLIEEAKVFDSINRKSEAIKSLSKAISKTDDISLQNKLKVVVREYSNSTKSLDYILAEFGISFSSSNSYESKAVIQPPKANSEDIFEKMKAVAYKEDRDLGFLDIGSEATDDKLRFMQEFGNMVDKKKQTDNDTVYVSWFQLTDGKTEFKNSFFTLKTKWGSQTSVKELNALIKQNLSPMTIVTVIATVVINEEIESNKVWATWLQISGGKTTFKNSSFNVSKALSKEGINEVNKLIKEKLEPNAYIALITNVSME